MIVTGEKKNPTLSFLQNRIVPARQVPNPDSPGNGTGLAGTTLSRRMTAWDSFNHNKYTGQSPRSGIPGHLPEEVGRDLVKHNNQNLKF